METKKNLIDQIISTATNNILCCLPTGYGKSKLALDIIKNKCKNLNDILIVIPRNVLIDNWKEEINKWNAQGDYTFTTYMSLQKHLNKEWNVIIFDECHHLSERCLEFLGDFKSKMRIFLSATVKLDLQFALRDMFKDLSTYKVNIRKAIEQNVLPDPEVYLYPLELDNTVLRQQIILNPKFKDTITIDFDKGGAKYLQMRNLKQRIVINCTDKQYSNWLNSQALTFKNRYYRTRKEVFLHIWQKTCLDRLKFLSNAKTNIVKEILKQYENKRTLTLCNSIEQCELLGENAIHSKNGDALDVLDKFNKGKINHITACGMLNEGVNLKDCEVGIFANLNSSEILTIQRIGRILRHKEPKIVIPYYIHTREEELVEQMKENYNKDLIKVIEL